MVELTIALHRVFNSPKDRIIWDVGHQAYVHKILTGRASGFDHLRQTGGMSGFPKASESEHDAFDTGHSSTSISAAAGYAAARDIDCGTEEVLAVIGDGALTGGMVYEAMNNVGASGSHVIIVLNDNGMSISKNIGGVSKHLNKLRTSSRYRSLKKNTKKVISGIPVVGKNLSHTISDTKEWMKYALISGGIMFEELGFTYLGPVDGNDIGEDIQVLRQASSVPGPVLVHVVTKKGKGYRNAEQNPDKFHGIGPFDIDTGRPLSAGGTGWSGVFGKTVLSLAERDSGICAITAAMGSATGFGEFSRRFPKRFFDVGIAEAHAVTFSAGLAKAGKKPFAAIYSTFLQRAYDQILEDVCLQDLPVVFGIDRAGIVGADGETHHGVFDLAYLLPMPNMRIFAPADGNDLEAMVEAAASCSHPTAIRYPRGNCRIDPEEHRVYRRKRADPFGKRRGPVGGGRHAGHRPGGLPDPGGAGDFPGSGQREIRETAGSEPAAPEYEADLHAGGRRSHRRVRTVYEGTYAGFLAGDRVRLAGPVHRTGCPGGFISEIRTGCCGSGGTDPGR